MSGYADTDRARAVAEPPKRAGAAARPRRLRP